MKKFRIVSLAIAFMMILSSMVLPVNANAWQIEDNTTPETSFSGDFSKALEKAKIDENEKFSVIVELEGDAVLNSPIAKTMGSKEYLETTAATTARERLVTTQEVVKLAITKRVSSDIKFKYSYTNVFNGFKADVTFGDLAELAKMPGVKNIYLDEWRELPKEPLMNSSNGIIGSPMAWDAGYKGEGTVVAVIDSSCEYSHEAMNISDKTVAKLNKEDIEKVIKTTNAYKTALDTDINFPFELTVEDAYKSKKVPFAFDYRNHDTNPIDADNDHGAHVSGTIAANKDAGDPTTMSDGAFNGVAPEAQILALKVMNQGGNDSDIMAGIDDAITLGADVMNLSLGARSGFTRYEKLDDGPLWDALYELLKSIDYGYLFDEAREAGILVAVAAGNDGLASGWLAGIYSSTVGYTNNTTNLSNNVTDYNLATSPDVSFLSTPASKFSATSVASMDNPIRYVVEIESKIQDWDNENNGESFYKKYRANDISAAVTGGDVSFSNLITQETSFVDCKFGDDDNLLANVSGKIALIQRGAMATFADKVQKAKEAGAIGVILFNNEYGKTIDEFNFSLASYVPDIPVIALSVEDGMQLQYRTVNKTVKAVEDSELVLQTISGFSSWGSTPDLKLKPEITAPGGNIYSIGVTGEKKFNAYSTKSGTSMATPHVAGAMALMTEHTNKKTEWFEKYSKAEKANIIEALLMSTANVMYNPNVKDEKVIYSPRQQGSGLMNVGQAVKSPAYLMNDESKRAKVQLYDNLTDEFEITFDVINLSNESLQYKLDGSIATDAYITRTVNSPDNKIQINNGTTERHFVAPYATNLDGTMSFEGNVFMDSTTTSAIDGIVEVPANDKVSVTVKVSLDSENTSKLMDVFTNGFFVEGFVELKSVDGKNPDLSIPYMGFYDSWKKAPIIDPMYAYEHSVKDSDYFYLGIPTNELYMNLLSDSIRYLPAGIKYEGAEGLYQPKNDVPRMGNYDWIAFSPDGDEFGKAILASFAARREFARIKIEVYNEKGEFVSKVQDDVYGIKSYAAVGYQGPAFASYNSNAWDGTDESGKFVPDGKYEFRIQTYLDYKYDKNSPDETMVIPVKVDTLGPTVKYRFDKSKLQVKLTAKDNEYMMWYWVKDENGNDYGQYFIEGNFKSKNEKLIDLSKVVGNKAIIYAFDNALNHTEIVIDMTGDTVSGEVKDTEMGPGNYPDKYSYTLTYDANYGKVPATVNDSESVVDTESTEVKMTVDGDVFTREGYKFLGWKNGDREIVEVGSQITFTPENTDVTLYAYWEKEGQSTPTPNPGTPSPNPGTPSPNPGTPAPNPGTPAPNPGTPAPNPGTPAPNPGTPAPNPGTPAPNPGTPSPNPGTPSPNPGTPAPNPGTTPNPGQGGDTTIEDDKVPAGQLPAVAQFDDLAAGAWYYNDVKAMLERGIMKGVSGTSFAPNAATNRAMIATILHRLDGEQAVEFRSVFSDVLSADWFASSVSWASLSEVVKGYEDGSFKPMRDITREQLATMIYRFIRTKGLGYKDGQVFELKFNDSQLVSDYAKEAVCWLNANGIINGKDGGNFDPQANATRAEVSAVINRVLSLLEKAN